MKYAVGSSGGGEFEGKVHFWFNWEKYVEWIADELMEKKVQ